MAKDVIWSIITIDMFLLTDHLKSIYLFISLCFGCAGSLMLLRLCSLLEMPEHPGALLLQVTGSRAHSLQELQRFPGPRAQTQSL